MIVERGDGAIAPNLPGHRSRRSVEGEPFALGPVVVDPPSRRVGAGGRSEMLEPRVMRVLVALGERPGKVLSRDDLIELCWDGLIVTDKAITRATSLLRHALEDMSAGTVRLETIPRVGFRLIVDGQQAGGLQPGEALPGVAEAAPSPVAAPATAGGGSRWSRRSAALGLVAVGGTAVIGYAGWLWTRQYVPDPRAAELFRQGLEIQKAGVAESMGEAIEAYKQAVVIDPIYADAWGALALSYRYPTYSEPRRVSDPREVRVAAGRALALDPDNADAHMALILADKSFRRWLEREARLRAFLSDHPDSALGHAVLGWMLIGVGRFEEALTASHRAIEIDPMRQIGWIVQVQALCFAGHNQEADLAVEEVRSRWPRDFRIWFLGYMVLADSRRYAEAITYLRATTRLPGSIAPDTMAILIGNAEAFSTGRGIAEYRNRNRTAPAATLIAGVFATASSMVVSGMTDELFALFEAFFFGGVVNGTRVAPPGPLERVPPARCSCRPCSRCKAIRAMPACSSAPGLRTTGASPEPGLISGEARRPARGWVQSAGIELFSDCVMAVVLCHHRSDWSGGSPFMPDPRECSWCA